MGGRDDKHAHVSLVFCFSFLSLARARFLCRDPSSIPSSEDRSWHPRRREESAPGPRVRQRRIHRQRSASRFLPPMHFGFALPSQCEDPYPRLRRWRAQRRASMITLMLTSMLAVAVSVSIGALCFIGLNEDPQAMRAKYGRPRCAQGRSNYAEAVNNFSPCCTHYSATCCDLHGESCAHSYAFLPLRSSKDRRLSETCEAALNMLSCARCSPYAGHFCGDTAFSRLSQRPNLTVCVDFCGLLWDHCGVAGADPTSALPPNSDAHAFCTAGLGLRVAAHPKEPCFSAGSTTRPARALSAFLALSAAAAATHAETRGGRREHWRRADRWRRLASERLQ